MVNGSPGQNTALRNRLEAGLERMAVAHDDAQIERLLLFLRLLTRWNRAYNLTAVRTPVEMVPRHLLDSLSISPFLFGTAILDAGTGAGLPGIPLAICHPDRDFELLDSNAKKIRFVRQVVLDLGLTNVTPVHMRLESYRPGRKFATIISRAVTGLSGLAAATEHLIGRPGRLLAMKGRNPAGDMDFSRPNAVLVHRLSVPFLDGERHLIEVCYD